MNINDSETPKSQIGFSFAKVRIATFKGFDRSLLVGPPYRAVVSGAQERYIK